MLSFVVSACGDDVGEPAPDPDDPMQLTGNILGVDVAEMGTPWYGELRPGYNLLALRTGTPCDLAQVDPGDVALIVGFCADVDPGKYHIEKQEEFCDIDGGIIAFVETGIGVDLAVGRDGGVEVVERDGEIVVEMDINFRLHAGIGAGGDAEAQPDAGSLHGRLIPQRCDAVVR